MEKHIKEKIEFVNPFESGVTYEFFLKAIPKGVTIKEYLKELNQEQIDWIENEINNYKNNK